MKKQPLVQEEKKGTEQKIIAAAISVFQAKGYAATRTRDIAEAAGINLALLNYYFRSKEKLFEIILLHTMDEFMQAMVITMNDKKTSLEKKVESVVLSYHSLLNEKPGIPLFVLNELRQGNHAVMFKALGLKKIFNESVFATQYQEGIKKGKYSKRPVLWLITNMMSLTIFPFMASPLLQMIGDADHKEYDRFIKSRKDFVTKWILQSLKP